MTEAETIELYEATDRSGNGLRNVFILGSLCDRNEQIAVSRQQVRALNLVQSLLAPPHRLTPGSRLCVVGAGVAGLTAAALAHHHGVQVTVLENREPLWNLRGCRTRWLHPNLFALWPHDGWDITATNFPVMNWYADYADRVGELLWAKYKSYVPSGQEPCIRIHGESLGVTSSSGQPRVTWRKRPDGASDESHDFDVVILAVGFGSEARMRDAASSEYWLDDALERVNPRGYITRYLVSGSGDGGLTDLLRLRLRNFRHHHLRDVLTRVPESVRARVRDIETRASIANRRVRNKPEQSAIDERLTTELLGLFDPRQPPEFLGGDYPFRDDTQVLLVSREPFALSPGRAWPVSRFLTAAVLASNGHDTRYRSVGPAGAKVSAVVPPDGEAPAEFRISIGSEVETVDAVVFRHGTRAIIRGFLQRWGIDLAVIERLEEKWSQRWALDGSTTDPLCSGPSLDNQRRDKEWRARPAISGRTPIGMLSRLVAQIDPDLPVSGTLVFPHHLPADLVTDGMVLSVTPSDAKRRTDEARGDWRLSGKIDHGGVLDTIRWIDQSLDLLTDHPATISVHRHQLEHHWVLPRFEWLPRAPADALLLNTCVARCWRARRLRYDWRPAGQLAQLAHMSVPTDRNEFVVVDLEDDHARVVLVAEAGPDDQRLARQLCATHLNDSNGLRVV